MKTLKDLWAVYKREIATQINSAMAYIFLIVFVFLASVLFMFLPPFFAFPKAEMTGLFGWMIPLLTIFAPAVTMRTWAEERKENTIEMLLTFPVKPWVLVAGKYLAVLSFYLAALLATWPVPVMLEALGEPDWGPILSGYLAAFLLGGFFLAVGVFISGFCRDQVTAFVLSFLACAFTALVGWDTFSGIIDGTIPGLGRWLSEVAGATAHYLPMVRGVVGVTDILYFLVWTGLFLFLNVVYLEGRRRPGAGRMFAGTVALALVIGGAFNGLVSDAGFGRFDCTENKIYTVSDASLKILRGLKVPVKVTLYISPSDKMPAEMKDLEQKITDKLREMRLKSGGKLDYKVIHMEAAQAVKAAGSSEQEKKDKEKSLEERLLDKGIEPFTVQALRNDQAVTQLVYSSIGVAYKEKEEEIIPQVVPQLLPELEYRLMSIIHKLTREKPPVVALVAPVDRPNIPPQLMQFYMQTGRTPPQAEDRYIFLQKILEHEKIDVRRVKLTRDDPLPDDFDALFVIDPRNLNERQKWEINRALVEGKPCFFAVQQHRWNYDIYRGTLSISSSDVNPGINSILEPNGLSVSKDILMDASNQTIRITDPSNPIQALLGGRPIDLPMQILVHPEFMNKDVSIVSHLGPLFYIWGSPLDIDEEKTAENKLEITTLFTSSDKAWTVPASRQLTEADLQPPAETSTYPLAVMVKGRFKDAFAGKERPDWPEPAPSASDKEAPPKPISPAPGRLILVGCAEMFTKNFLSRANLDFFMNCTDVLTLSEDLVRIRAKKPIDRTFPTPSAVARRLWQFVTLFLMALVFAAAGIVRVVLVKRARERYRASLQEQVG